MKTELDNINANLIDLSFFFEILVINSDKNNIDKDMANGSVKTINLNTSQNQISIFL